MRYAAQWPKYAKWWDAMVIKPARVAEFEAEAKFAFAHKTVYDQITNATGLPWHMIAVLHRRESDANFNAYLGNGQPLDKRTTGVPVGRGPFTGPNAFFNGAVDAIRQEGWTNIKDWRLEKELYYCEAFNGWGYAGRGLPSPYLWGGTNIQRPGKYIGDRKWSGTKLDPQPGCAPLLATIRKLDPTVQFVREA